MKIHNNRYLIVIFAAMLLFSNVAWAVGLCLMDEGHASAPAQKATPLDEDPCCADAQDQRAVAPDDCCSMLALQSVDEAPSAFLAYAAPVLPVVTSLPARVIAWPGNAPPSAPSPRDSGPPLNLLFKNFRI